MTEIFLPVCPSTNALYKNARRGRVKTPEYLNWLTEAGYRLNAAHVAPVASPVAITMRFGKLRSNADLGNREKAATDLLVAHKVIQDDSVTYVRRILLEYCPDTVPEGFMEISLTTIA